LSPISSYVDSFDTPQSVIKALCDYQVGMSNILSYIQANAPMQYANVLSNWESKISYYFYESSGKSHAFSSTNEIFITQLNAVFHETIHILVHPLVGQGEAWKGEGIAEYLSFLDGTINKLEYIAYSYLTADTEGLEGNDLIFVNMIREYYFSKAPYPQGLDDTDYSLFYKAGATITLTNPELANSELKITISRLFTESFKESRDYLNDDFGNDLTYPKAYLFTKYLIDMYDLDTMLSCCFNEQTFEEAFGKTKEEAFADFMATLKIRKIPI